MPDITDNPLDGRGAAPAAQPRPSLEELAKWMDFCGRHMGGGALLRQMHDALKKAEQFIANGVEFGFIRLPDVSTPDSAHETLPAIRAAIAAADGR